MASLHVPQHAIQIQEVLAKKQKKNAMVRVNFFYMPICCRLMLMRIDRKCVLYYVISFFGLRLSVVLSFKHIISLIVSNRVAWK